MSNIIIHLKIQAEISSFYNWLILKDTSNLSSIVLIILQGRVHEMYRTIESLLLNKWVVPIFFNYQKKLAYLCITLMSS